MVGKEDFVKFIGVIKTTGFTPISLFRHLSKGEIYKVEEVMKHEDNSYYYYIGCTCAWYPIENFEQSYSRNYIKDKYDLK